MTKDKTGDRSPVFFFSSSLLHLPIQALAGCLSIYFMYSRLQGVHADSMYIGVSSHDETSLCECM